MRNGNKRDDGNLRLLFLLHQMELNHMLLHQLPVRLNIVVIVAAVVVHEPLQGFQRGRLVIHERGSRRGGR